MKQKLEKEKILILGGSGFIGHALYRELQSYFEVYGTYFSQIGNFSENQMFFQFDLEQDDVLLILQKVKPTVIISAVKGNYEKQIILHESLATYASKNGSRILFFSTNRVFDAKMMHPSYEKDVPLSQSEFGKFKITIEKLLLKNLPGRTAILRLPLVLGINSPEIFHLRQCIRHQAAYEVYPNLVVTATTINKLCLQVHYIINQSLTGIFHLSSSNMIHHDDLFLEITEKISEKTPIFKKVYTSNDDRYMAILPRDNKLAAHYQITIEEVIEESGLDAAVVSIV